MATKKNKASNTKTAIEVGAGALALAAAAGAGYYFYGDKNAKKHRKAASAWAKGMKQDVVKEAKKLKRMDQKTVAAVVDKAAAAYQGVRSVDAADLRAAARELKKNWREVEREVKGAGSRAAKAVKKSASKARTTAKKSAPKKAAPKKAVKRGAKRGAKK